MIDFKDRVAIVTGAGGGLGRAHALLLASRGAAVVVNDLGGSVHGEGGGHNAADDVVTEIRQDGGTAVANYASVADPDGAASLTEQALSEFGRVDIVVNNAGILRDRSFPKLEWADLDAVLDVHLKGTFYVTRPAFLKMKEQGYGRIVVTSSASGVFGNFGQANYGAAKMGLVGLMNVLKHEGAKYDIKANGIAPIAHTRMTEDIFSAFLGDLASLLEADAVAPVVAYLASEQCEVSGELWSVGGGSVSRMFVGLTDGYFKHPVNDGVLTIEDVAAHVKEIRDEDGYLVPYSLQDELSKLGPKLLG